MTEEQLNRSEVQPANPVDFSDLKVILDRANQYSLTKGSAQAWRNTEKAYADLQHKLNNGECYIVRNSADEISSAIALSDSSTWWPEKGDDHTALYVYKLMKDPSKAQPGEGVQLLHFAAEEAVRRGKSLLRCDTLADAEGLLSYYNKYGFKLMSNFDYQPSGVPGVLLEAEVKEVLQKTDQTNEV